MERKHIGGLGYPKLSMFTDAFKTSWAKRIHTSNIGWRIFPTKYGLDKKQIIFSVLKELLILKQRLWRDFFFDCQKCIRQIIFAIHKQAHFWIGLVQQQYWYRISKAMLENGVRHIRDFLDPELKFILSQYFVGNVKCDFLMFETIRFRIQNYLINSKKKPVMLGPH